MKIRTKLISGFLLVVLIFGIATMISQYMDNQRENQNIITLYEERGVSIAKTLDSSIISEEQLQAPDFAQGMIDRMIASDIGIEEISVHAKAPDGKSESGYWRLASNDRTIIKTASDPEDLEAINKDKYNVLFEMVNGIRIIDVTYPIHDNGGKPIATAGIKFSMEKEDKSLASSNSYMFGFTVLMMVIAIVIGFVISNSLTKPINQLRDVADNVTNGNFDVKIPESKSNDEVSDLSASMEMLVMALKSKTGK